MRATDFFESPWPLGLFSRIGFARKPLRTFRSDALFEAILDRLFEIERDLRDFAVGELHEEFEAAQRCGKIVCGDRDRRYKDTDHA